ncbi:MAG: LysM peptidoglycan-binding domain-containing protein [bacterium]|nr:LysM peptidoglycan-binding domain-containing protein [bacterium]
MAGRKKTKATPGRTSRNVSQDKRERRTSGGILEYVRFSESYTSLVLGIVVVIIFSVLLISFLKGLDLGKTPPAPEISATKIEPLVSATPGEILEGAGQVTPESTTPPSTSGGRGTYTVQPGDDLWNIAVKVYNDGYKWTLIANANNITNPGMIFAGDVLKTPEAAAVGMTKGGQGTQAAMPTLQPAIIGNSYKVQHGDTLWSIAERRYKNGYRWVDIAKANNLTDPNLIHADNTVQLPQ